MQPDRIGVPADERIHIHPFDGSGAPHALLFPVDRDGHVLLTPPLLLSLSSRRAFASCHGVESSNLSPNNVQAAGSASQ
jgi:hypothetical protein